MIILTDVDPCKIKFALRRDYYNRFKINNPARCAQEAIDRSMAFWPKYEQVNRDYCPDDPVYSTVRAGAALSVTADHLHFKAPASGQVRLLEYILSGEATASAVNRVALAQMNATLASASALTPEKFNSRSPAAAGTYGHSNTSALLAGNILVWAVNAFGGFIDWKAAPGEEIYFVNGEVISLRSLSGTSTFSSTAIFEEL
jgi:hypothetical protein